MLTTRQVQSIKAAGRYHDARGLYLRVRESGSRSWLFVYQLDGQAHYIGLGSAAAVSLKEARRKIAKFHELLADGVDPLRSKREAKDKERQQRRTDETVEQFAKEFVRLKSPGWKNPKTAKQFMQTLQLHAKSVLRLPAKSVTVDDMVQMLQPIWSEVPVMAEHVRANLAMVFDSVEARGVIDKNPARLKLVVAAGLPPISKIHTPRNFAAMPYKAVPAFFRRLDDEEGIAPQALQFLILTAVRTHNVIEAEWAEIDTKAKLWSIPAEKMKSPRPHRVPLSAPALKLLERVPREKGNPYIFPGGKAGRGLSNMAMAKLLRGLDATATVHGFRSSFKDWSREKTDYSNEVSEAALAHVVGSTTERAYARSDLLDLRVPLMDAWGRFCAGKR